MAERLQAALEASIAEDAARQTLADIQANATQARAQCRSLIGFVRRFWPILEPSRPFVEGWAIEAICSHLEAVSDGKIQYLLINVPPGMMKSLLVAVFWPAWEWAMRDATLRYLSTSFSRNNVIRDNSKMRRLVESDAYRVLFPHVALDPSSNAKDKFENLKTGNREGRAFESMTGGRGDRVLIDDPHSVTSAESDVQREEVVKTFREAIPDRLNDLTKSAIVVIMQRLHANDVAGTILKLGFPYVHLNLPMEFEPTRKVNGEDVDNRCRTYLSDGTLFFEDPRTVEGELLFPERFPEAEVAALKTVKGPYAWAGQYQQRPTAREGGLFKRAWFAGKIMDRKTLPASLRRVRAWDFAATAEEEEADDPDWTAGVRMARHGVDYYVENVTRDRLSAAMVQRLVRAMAETDPVGTLIRIPQDPSQAGKGQAQSYVTALAGFPLKSELTTGRGNKVGRALPLSIQAEFGHIYLVNSGPPEDGLDAWIEPFLDELCSFPAGHHDDQVDAAADAFAELALADVVDFRVESAGKSDILKVAERDSRYQFGDMGGDDRGAGFGSVRSRVGIDF